jgi:DNA-binding GntR family transcriptional regulator
LNGLFDKSERYMNLLEFVVGLEYKDVAEHKEIVSFIEARDKTGATEAMNRHILRVLHELQEHAMARGWTVIQQLAESS